MSRQKHVRGWQKRCKPAQIIFSGIPSRFIECPACKQRFEGIPYPFGRHLYTLPDHLPEEGRSVAVFGLPRRDPR